MMNENDKEHPEDGARLAPQTCSASMPEVSCAWWITCSPHEWTWTQEEQEAMARAVVEMSGRIHRASVAFCGDQSDAATAAEMFQILSEPNASVNQLREEP